MQKAIFLANCGLWAVHITPVTSMRRCVLVMETQMEVRQANLDSTIRSQVIAK